MRPSELLHAKRDFLTRCEDDAFKHYLNFSLAPPREKKE
jgi:hypothetical protein